MLDNQLIAIIIDIMRTSLAAQGYVDDTAIAVKQAFQPRNQGVNLGPGLYLYKNGDHRYGYLKRESKYISPPGIMQHIETQFYETTFTFEGLKIQDPADTTSVTASDMANLAAAIMQSDATRATLKENGLGILRISDVTNPAFMDDKNRFEYSPSFNFTIEHDQVIISEDPIATDIIINIERV